MAGEPGRRWIGPDGPYAGPVDEHADRPVTTRRVTTKRMAGAVLLGAATVLVPKTDPEAHWSKSPVPTLEVQTPARAGLDDLPDPDDLLAALPPVLPVHARRRWRLRRSRRPR
jgi:ferric-dicitrate binding protein FerR (iron transport regulator)